MHIVAALEIVSSVLGFGMGTVFATGLSWLESFLQLNNWLGTLLVIAGTVGPDIFPVVVGQFLEWEPMVLMYLNCATIIVCIVLFQMTALASRCLST